MVNFFYLWYRKDNWWCRKNSRAAMFGFMLSCCAASFPVLAQPRDSWTLEESIRRVVEIAPETGADDRIDRQFRPHAIAVRDRTRLRAATAAGSRCYWRLMHFHVIDLDLVTNLIRLAGRTAGTSNSIHRK